MNHHGTPSVFGALQVLTCLGLVARQRLKAASERFVADNDVMTLLKATRLRLGDVLIMIEVIGCAPGRIYEIFESVESGIPLQFQSANCYSWIEWP